MIEPKPLIVFGMGRSGTRMCANILNNSNDVELQGEIGGRAGTKMMSWLEAARAQRKHDDASQTYELARGAFRLGSAGKALVRENVRWFGHKTPRHERHFKRYEAIFDDASTRAIYVYCIRNPFDVWKSYRAMPWNKFKTVDEFLKAWVRSVHMYEAMVQKAPGRVLMFNLDAMIRAPDWLTYVRPALLEPLAIGEDTFRRPVEELGNTNSAERKVGAKPEPISDADRRVIASHPATRRIIERHFPWINLGPADGRKIATVENGPWTRLQRAMGQAWRGATREWKRARRA